MFRVKRIANFYVWRAILPLTFIVLMPRAVFWIDPDMVGVQITAFLYFEGPGEAVAAAFALRDELLERRKACPDLPLPRISLDRGPLVIGVIGTRFRQTVALVGPAVHRAARILKLAPPGGIVATEPIIEHTRESDPGLARAFERSDQEFVLDQRHPNPVPIWISPPPRVRAQPVS